MRMEVGEMRRTTLSEQLAVLQSSNLRDLLKVREEEVAEDRDGGGGQESLTLGDVLASDKREGSATAAASLGSPTGTHRTLFEIIRQEECSTAAGSSSWRALRDLLRLGGGISDSFSITIADLENAEISGAEADATEEDASRREVRTEDTEGSGGGGSGSGVGAEEEQPVRVSLMALLEEAEGQGGDAVPMTPSAEEEEEPAGGKAACVCCVCMVRHKGAAFIPCGHTFCRACARTFCRACARDVWAARSACPLCNRLILDILHIF